MSRSLKLFTGFGLLLIGLLSAPSVWAGCISPDAAAEGHSLPEGYRYPSGGFWYECKDNVWQKSRAVSVALPYSKDRSGSCLPLGLGIASKDGMVSMTYREEKSKHTFFGKVHQCVNGNWWQLPQGKSMTKETSPAPKATPVKVTPPAIPEYPDEEPQPVIKVAEKNPGPEIDVMKKLEALEKMEATPVPRSPAKEVVSPTAPAVPDYEAAPAPAPDPKPPAEVVESRPTPAPVISIKPKLPPGSAEAPDQFEHSEDYKQCLAHCTEGRDKQERDEIYKCKKAGFEKYGLAAWPKEGVDAFNRCRILAARNAKNKLQACLLPCRKQERQYIWEGN